MPITKGKSSETDATEAVRMRAAALPHAPGVYHMLGSDGRVLYIGKAKDLHKRVNSYFRKDYQHSTRTRKLLKNVRDIAHTVVASELEALILETDQIKKHRPKYNILMKDDKSYVYLKINLDEDFPQISIVRARERERMGDIKGHAGRARYFGPTTAAHKLYKTFRLLKRLFPFRHCALHIADQGKNPKGIEPRKVKVTNRVIDFPCLDYYIKRCPAPCIGAIGPEEYRTIIQRIIAFLEGKHDDVMQALTTQMRMLAANKKFEQAASIRDTLQAIEGLMERKSVSDPRGGEFDVINVFPEGEKYFFHLFIVRNGKLVDSENFTFDALFMQKPRFDRQETYKAREAKGRARRSQSVSAKSAERFAGELYKISRSPRAQSASEPYQKEALEAFLAQFYERASEIPREILIPEIPENYALLEAWLQKERKGTVRLRVPERGKAKRLLDLCQKNAQTYAHQSRASWEQEQKAALEEIIQELRMLKLKKLDRLECYDISHIQGSETVGSMVVFEKGLPKKAHYRHFKLRTVQGKPDDFASMQEVLTRRLKYLTSKPPASIVIKTPVKKEFEEIISILEKAQRQREDFVRADFVALKRGKNILGFCRLRKFDATTGLLSSLWVHPKERGKRFGYHIMRKLIDRCTVKRIYIDTTPAMESYFAEFGFQTIRETPRILQNYMKHVVAYLKKNNMPIESQRILFMAYDKSKHKIDESFAKKPDLLVIDGGKPQLTAALNALATLRVNIPVVALAKRLEEIYVPGEKAPVLLQKGTAALRLLQHIRDEAHRFALQYHRKLHRTALLK